MVCEVTPQSLAPPHPQTITSLSLRLFCETCQDASLCPQRVVLSEKRIGKQTASSCLLRVTAEAELGLLGDGMGSLSARPPLVILCPPTSRRPRPITIGR